MNDHFGIGGGLEQATRFNKAGAQAFGINQIAIMGNGKITKTHFCQERLDIAHFIQTSGRIAVMANSNMTFQIV